MVKDECDIIKEWIIYHGSIFGFHNIHIIDNYSTDGTYEIMKTFEHLIHIYQLPDYKKKGQYMTTLIKINCINEIAIPMDIDEFIVLYDKENHSINTNKYDILNYFENIEISKIYKMNYIIAITNQSENINGTLYGEYNDIGDSAKVFINTSLFDKTLDHGNHFICNDYVKTDVCLLHFHNRNVEQMKKKVKNNISGLGFPTDLESLKNIIHNNPNIHGWHHITHQISIYENTFSIQDTPFQKDFIILKPFTDAITNLQKDFIVYS